MPWDGLGEVNGPFSICRSPLLTFLQTGRDTPGTYLHPHNFFVSQAGDPVVPLRLKGSNTRCPSFVDASRHLRQGLPAFVRDVSQRSSHPRSEPA